MLYFRYMKRRVLYSALFLLISVSLVAQETPPASNQDQGLIALLQLRWGIAWLGQGTATTSDTGSSNGISSSQIIHHFGLGSQLSFSPLLGIAPSIDVYLDDYIYLEQYKRAFPTQAQTGSALGPLATVLVLGINVPWFMSLPLDDNVWFNLAAGLGFVLQIPLVPLDGTGDISDIGGYTLGDARWLNIYIEPGFRFRMVNWFGFSLSPKVIFPIWHAWDSHEIPFHDNFQVGLVIGFEFYF